MLFAVRNGVAGLDGAVGEALGGGRFGGGFAAVRFADSTAGGGVGLAPRELLRHCGCGFGVVRLERSC